MGERVRAQAEWAGNTDFRQPAEIAAWNCRASAARNLTRSGFAQVRVKSNNPKIFAPPRKTIRCGNFSRRKHATFILLYIARRNFYRFNMRKIATIIIAGALAASAPAGAEDAPKHAFQGQWITSAEFANAEPVNVFHRQYEFESGKRVLEKSKALQNRHTLFRGGILPRRTPQGSPPVFLRRRLRENLRKREIRRAGARPWIFLPLSILRSRRFQIFAQGKKRRGNPQLLPGADKPRVGQRRHEKRRNLRFGVRREDGPQNRRVVEMLAAHGNILRRKGRIRHAISGKLRRWRARSRI